MNNQSFRLMILTGIMVLSCGCQSISTSRPAAGVIDRLYALEKTHPPTSGAPSGTSGLTKHLLEHLPPILQHDPIATTLLSHVTATNTCDLGICASDLKEFARKFHEFMNAGLFKNLNDPEKLKAAYGTPTLENVLLAYYTAYQKGKFVLRDGPTLGAPKLHIKSSSGKVSGSVDNDTTVGLITVFQEALFDCAGKDLGMAAPLYYKTITTTNWVEDHIPSSVPDHYLQVFKPDVKEKDRDFLLNGKVPTAALIFTNNVCEIIEKKPNAKKGVTEKELQFVHFASGLAADQSKHLAGFIVRSLGSMDAGMFVMGSFSIGNNETLAKIIETLMACNSRRFTEHELLVLFRNYDGKDPAVNAILENYDWVYNLIDGKN